MGISPGIRKSSIWRCFGDVEDAKAKSWGAVWVRTPLQLEQTDLSLRGIQIWVFEDMYISGLRTREARADGCRAHRGAAVVVRLRKADPKRLKVYELESLLTDPNSRKKRVKMQGVLNSPSRGDKQETRVKQQSLP